MATPLSLFMPISSTLGVAELGLVLAENVRRLHEALGSIGTVHYARFLLLDRSSPNLQPHLGTGPFVLAVITEYDGSFQAYINDFVAQVGEIFDDLLKHVDGGPALIPVKDNISAFLQFVMQNDASQHLPNKEMYQAYPFTVQQILASCPSSLL